VTARALNQIIKIARAENTNLLTVGVSLGTGIFALYNGSIPWGLTLTGAALNEVKKIITRNFAPTTEAKTLAEEVKTGLLMIEQLEEYQKSSLATIVQQIDIVQEQLDAMEDQIKEIEELATTGSKDGELKKREAQKLSQAAANAYRQALYTLQLSRSGVITTVNHFKVIIEEFTDLIEQAKSEQLKPHDIERFIERAEKILKEMTEMQKILASSQEQFNTGLRELKEASDLNKQALVKQAEAMATLHFYLKEIQLKAQMEKDIQKTKSHLSKAKDETNVAAERADNIQQIAEYERKKIEQLQNQLDDQWGTTSMIAGTAAATVGIVAGGGVLSVPAGFGVAGLTHYSRRIYRFVDQYFSRPQPIANPPKNLIEYKIIYNPKSTGWGNYTVGLVSGLMGRKVQGSKTAGVIAINLGGDHPFVYKFNKNSASSQGKMDEADMKRLVDDLRKSINEGKLTYQECLNLINSLSDVATEYGNVSLVNSDAVFFKDLKRECERNLT
jgi:chemotaxis protein histidine kinase CheA